MGLLHLRRGLAGLGGKPCIKGTHISVEFILELVVSGASHDDVVKTYSHLTTENVAQALRYAAESLKNDIVLTAEVEESGSARSAG